MATISQINGNGLADSAFRAYVNTVGAGLISFNDDFSPSALFGGSWERITDRFIVGAGGSYALGSTGGATSHEHTIDGLAKILETQTHVFSYAYKNGTVPWTSTHYFRVSETGGESVQPSSGVDIDGYTDGGSNLPPYIACNIWRRVA